MTLNNKLEKIDVDLFIRECKEQGLDPKRTTSFTLDCVKYGLDPGTASLFLVECTKYKLDPKIATLDDLRNAGSTRFDYDDEVE
ncbi:hypothetical protein HZA97_08345 [Candidatus Woesearchaeota archaeon]|nr:hypothetical protein [Candidatus Woesearchaeota archaeon]